MPDTGLRRADIYEIHSPSLERQLKLRRVANYFVLSDSCLDTQRLA